MSTVIDFCCDVKSAYKYFTELDWKRVADEQAECQAELNRLTSGECSGHVDHAHPGNEQAERAYRRGFFEACTESLAAFECDSIEPCDVIATIYDQEHLATEKRKAVRERLNVGKHYDLFPTGSEIEIAEARGRCHGMISAVHLAGAIEQAGPITLADDQDEPTDDQWNESQAKQRQFILGFLPAYRRWVKSVKRWASDDCQEVEIQEFFFEHQSDWDTPSDPIFDIAPWSEHYKDRWQELDQMGCVELIKILTGEAVRSEVPKAKTVAQIEANMIDDDEDELDDALSAQTPFDDSDFPADCLRPPGLIGDLIDYTLSVSKYPQPIHALAGAVCFMSLLTGRRVRDVNDTTPNIMIISIGPTRSGKEASRKVIKQILTRIGKSELFEEKLASDAALHGFLGIAPSGILIQDEIGDWLAQARSKNGPSSEASKIITSILSLYSSANGLYKGKRYANNSQQVVIDQPNLVLLGSTTGEIFWKHVTPDYLAGGLFGRVMLFDKTGYVLPQSAKDRSTAIPESLLTEVKAWLGTYGTDVFANWTNPIPTIVPHDGEALDRFEQHEMDIAKKRIGENPIRAAMWSGTAETTGKLALLFACSRSRNPLQIRLQDVELAIRLSNYLTRRKVALCADNVAENAVEDATKRVYRIIKDTKAKGITKNDLTRRTQWLKPRDREEIIITLVNSRQVALREVRTKTKTKVVIVASVSAC